MNWDAFPPQWNTPAGLVLDAFLAAVQRAFPGYAPPVTVFGSAPIQLCLDEAFASADIDVMVVTEHEKLRQLAKDTAFQRDRRVRPAYGVQIAPPQLFKPTPHYLLRAHSEVRHGIKVIIPHLRDILIAKLHRSRFEGQEGLVPKDNRAFQRVRELCGGHPTLEEVLEDLMQCEAYFRPPVDGSLNAFRFNVEDLLAAHYGHALDLERDILAPARRGGSTEPGRPESLQEMIREFRPSRK